MASRQLESIIATIPSATASGEAMRENNVSRVDNNAFQKKTTGTVKIVATANENIKEELKRTAKEMGVTETIIILKALKNFGFQSINDTMLIDKRTLR